MVCVYGPYKRFYLSLSKIKVRNKTNNGNNDIDYECSRLTRQPSGCRFKNNAHRQANLNNPVLDIEELLSRGRKEGICPYYQNRSGIKRADIIIAPYNYVLGHGMMEKIFADVDISNSVFIFDKAHNLEEFACESVGFDLTLRELRRVLIELDRLSQCPPDPLPEEVTSSHYQYLIRLTRNLARGLTDLIQKQVSDEDETATSMLFQLLGNMGISGSTQLGVLCDCLDKITESSSLFCPMLHHFGKSEMGCAFGIFLL